MKNFTELNLHHSLIEAIENVGWKCPTRIQAEAIPKALNNFDIIGLSETGSGKTGAYCLSVLHHWINKDKPNMFALVLLPTVELASQVCDEFEKLGSEMGIKVLTLIGGSDINEQLMELGSLKHHVIVATPGRILMMMYHTKNVVQTLDMFQHLIIDEADKMMNYKLGEDIEKILSVIPKKPSIKSIKKSKKKCVFRQTQLYSATYYGDVEKKYGFLLYKPEFIDLSTPSNFPSQLKHYMWPMSRIKKEENLFKAVCDYIVKVPKDDIIRKCIIFVEECNDTSYYVTIFENMSINAIGLNSRMARETRISNIEKIKSGSAQLLISTDVASRGLDIKDVVLVINLDIPDLPDTYRHRVGRTARVGKEGTAITFVYPDTKNEFVHFEKKLQLPIKDDNKSNSGRMESYAPLGSWELTEIALERLKVCIKKARREDMNKRKRKHEDDTLDHYINKEYMDSVMNRL